MKIRLRVLHYKEGFIRAKVGSVKEIKCWEKTSMWRYVSFHIFPQVVQVFFIILNLFYKNNKR